MKRLVVVTSVLIEEGVPGSAESCPVNLAIQKAFGAVEVRVCGGVVTAKVHWRGNDIWAGAILPAVACDFITAFDRGQKRKTRPIAFDLEL